MPSYPDHANTDLLERIPLSAGVVLDVDVNEVGVGEEPDEDEHPVDGEHGLE